MTINSNNNYTNINNTQQNNILEKLSTGLAINKASDDASSLAIATKLGVQKSSAAQSVENVNSGVALTNIAQEGISNQKEILENIKIESLKALNGTTSQEGRDAIANQIGKYIEQFEQIAESTNYNGQKLLKASGDPFEDEISITGDDSNISIKKADTTSISDELKTFLSDFSTNPDSVRNLLDAVDKGIDTLSAQESEFGSSSNSLESLGRNYLTAETNAANAQSTLLDLDYSKGIANFNKTNIQTQVGFLAQSQANAVQSRVLSLLS